MKRRRLRSAKQKGKTGTYLIDYISQMPDDVLVMILSRLPIKRAVVTSSLSTRWRFVWRNMTVLNFDGSETFDRKVERNEGRKFCDDALKVICSYNHPRVQVFRVRFDLCAASSEVIEGFIMFAVEKKVEKLELDFRGRDRSPPDEFLYNYVSDPSSYALAGEKFSLKTLDLRGVYSNEEPLIETIKNSPHLETLYLYDSILYPHVRFGGQCINVKHFKVVNCSGFGSISLSSFDLVSFTYCGPEIELNLTDLPKLKELDVGEVSVGLENNVFSRMSSCALYLQVLILDIRSPKKGLNVDAIPKFPNVKKLTLAMEAEYDDSLLEFTAVAQACPNLETFAVTLEWNTPMKRRRKVRRVAIPHIHKHLKLLKLIGFYGRISDLELAVYVIDNAVALKKIVIDPCCHALRETSISQNILKKHEAARSSARRQLAPILPSGVDLAIL